MNLSAAKLASKLGWNSRVCGRTRIISNVGINKLADARQEGYRAVSLRNSVLPGGKR
jgi:hypothetical protein